jgi:DNA-binding transcriptional LysR family regulator
MADLVEFRHLKYIVAVAETSNFTRAAERLFLAQPSLSKQIKDLEDEIGFPIFVRNRDGVRITPAGQMIIAYAKEALSARVEVITMARAVHRGEVAPLRLGFSPFVNPELLEFFRDAYASLFPDCPIHLSGGNSLQVLQRLEQETLDGALLPMPIEGPNWVIEQLARDPLVVCMRTDDTLARAPEVSVSDVSAKLKIFRDPEIHPTAHDRLVELLIQVGIDPEASCLAATPADIQWMVRAGYGVALVDQRTILDAGLTTRPIAGIHWTADTAFVHHKKADHLALPFLVRSLHRTTATALAKRTIPPKATKHASIKSSCLVPELPAASLQKPLKNHAQSGK